MGEVLGADVEALDQIVRRLSNASQTADGVRGSLGNMATELRFYGRYGDEFTMFVAGQAAPALGRAAEALATLGDVVLRHARAQQQVSDGDGLSGSQTAAAVGAVAGAGVLAAAAQGRGGARQQQGRDPNAPRVGDRTSPTEAGAVGAQNGDITRESDRFRDLVSNDNPDIVFKDEEGTGADRMMTPRLRDGLDDLAARVQQEWPGRKLRVTEAWDESNEHSANSYHYEGRAADITVDDRDPAKLARLYQLADAAGLDWVYYEDRQHVHVSVRAR